MKINVKKKNTEMSVDQIVEMIERDRKTSNMIFATPDASDVLCLVCANDPGPRIFGAVSLFSLDATSYKETEYTGMEGIFEMGDTLRNVVETLLEWGYLPQPDAVIELDM